MMEFAEDFLSSYKNPKTDENFGLTYDTSLAWVVSSCEELLHKRLKQQTKNCHVDT